MSADKTNIDEPDDEYELTFKYFKDEFSYAWHAFVQETKEEITGSPENDTFIDCFKALGGEIKGSFSDCGKWISETIRQNPLKHAFSGVSVDKTKLDNPDDEYELNFNYFKDELSYAWHAFVQETKEEITGSPENDTFIDCCKALGEEIKGSFSDCGKWVSETIRPKPPAP